MFYEYESAVYSFTQEVDSIPKTVFYGILYFSSSTQPIFMAHNFKTVPYITVSLQKQKRLETEEFYKEEDRWLVRPD